MMISGHDYISEVDFRSIWGAHGKMSGDLYWREELMPMPLEFIWTVLEGESPDDRNWYASPGVRLINSLGYVVTARPWDDTTPDAIWFLDD